MGLIEILRGCKTPSYIKNLAKQENLDKEIFVKRILSGEIVVPKNSKKALSRICAVGKGLKTKVNANIGTSPDLISLEMELDKLFACIDAGADAVMDLSTGGDLNKIRRKIIDSSNIPVGTVPIYNAACVNRSKNKEITELEAELLFNIIEEHAADGVDFMTVHCGITKKSVAALVKNKRLTGVVSRGGSFLAKWIIRNNKENPLYAEFDRLLDIAKKYDITLSLGDGLRPGSLYDATDAAQLAELNVLGELVVRCRKAGVQVMVEGPGHVPMNQVEKNVRLAKKICRGAPLYLLGPIVTDIAPGYDHITSAIGGAIAASCGADFICYVTPAEHLRLPDVQDVHEGVIAARIAGHAADIAKGVSGAIEWDHKFSKFRKDFNWQEQEKLSIDPKKFAKERAKVSLKDESVCSMCGQFCAMKEDKQDAFVK